MKTPGKVSHLYLEATCVGINQWEWDRLMDGATRANKKAVNKLVKNHLPDLYGDLSLNLRNPYNYFKTKTHLILVHSGIEYFIRFEN
jgi:hypothetical protein